MRTLRLPGRDSRSTVAVVLVLVPVFLLAWLGWNRRWTADDAFINFRVVSQFRAGNGLVYNIGERVESGTSPLWIALLALGDLVTPIRLEWLALIGGLGSTLVGLAFAIFGTRRALLHIGTPIGWLMPVGALVYAVLPPAWDFSTSGLENGIGVLWLGAGWWLLVREVVQADPPAGSRRWWLPVVLGIGPLIRPDFAVFSVAFLTALLIVSRRSWGATVLTLGVAFALPIAYEIFRMAYFASVVPQAAIVKEASLTRWDQGWLYVRDLFGPYRLLIPVAIIAGVFAVPLFLAARNLRSLRTITAIFVAAGLIHGVYVVRVGGDYMHGRMLLPALFTVLVPISVVCVRTWQWVGVAALVAWAMVCAASLRTPYSGPHPLHPEISYGVVSPTTGIGDERLYYMRLAELHHPVTLTDYLKHSNWAQSGALTKLAADSGARGLLTNPLSDQHTLIPLRPDVRSSIVAYTGVLGMFSYAAGNHVAVVDNIGLADAVAGHVRLLVRGRPGHEKIAPDAWAVARLTDADVPVWASTADDVRAARRALQCGDLAELQEATSSPLTMSRIFKNLRDAARLSSFRYQPNPHEAELELCSP